MIQLTCTKCRALLDIDDAFAGGACRCRHCGTIQTVPVQLKSSSPSAAPPGTAATRAKTLFQGAARAGAGLEALASVVAGGAPGGRGAPSGDPRHASGRSAPRPSSVLIVIAAIALLAGGAWFAWTALPPAAAPESAPGASANSAAVVSSDGSMAGAASAFMGVDLRGPSVIYLLDRGQSMAGTFDLMRVAAIRSLETLSPEMQFQFIFWETDRIIAFPEKGMAYATPENVAAARTMLQEAYFGGQSRLQPALQAALAQNPAELVIATAKFGLGQDFAWSVLELHKESEAPIHTLSLGEDGSPEAMRTIAERTGGVFRQVGMRELRSFSE